VLAATSALGLVACGSGAGSGGWGTSSGGPIAVGYLVPLTSSVAANGLQEKQSRNLAMRQLGSKVDGLPGDVMLAQYCDGIITTPADNALTSAFASAYGTRRPSRWIRRRRAGAECLCVQGHERQRNAGARALS
jgi:hypothetical protein